MLFRAVATPHQAITGAPGRAIAEWPHAALNFLALEPLKLQKSALPAAILLIAAAAFLNYMVLSNLLKFSGIFSSLGYAQLSPLSFTPLFA